MENESKNLEGLPVKKILMSQIMDDPMNPNVMKKAQLEALEFSMKTEGNVVPIIINKVKDQEKPYMIVNGHQRLMVLRKQGITKVASIIIEKSINEARAFGLALNRNVGEDNPEKLSKLFLTLFKDKKLQLIKDFVPQFDSDFVKLTIDKFQKTSLGIAEEPAEVLEIPESTTTQPGDIYQIGRHKLMCGDCTSKDDIKQLLGEVTIDQICTDPPYGVEYHGENSFLNVANKKTRRHKIANDDDSVKDYIQFFKSFLELVPMAEYNTVYIFMAGTRLHELRIAFDRAGFTWGDYLIWVKNHFVMGRKDHKAKHEFIMYGWKGKHKFYGEYGTPTVYLQDKPQKSEEHPTMKPVELVARLIIESSKKWANVYEPFSGSGTTLLACEQNDRVCYAIEKVPHYVDLAIKRWEYLTKKKAVKLD